MSRLPGPSAEVWDWQRYGACRGHDSGQFFHPDGERGASRLRREIAAKSICRTCPVRAECATHALAAREPYGVWGGFTESERLRLLATGWEDASRVPGQVDVSRLEARLGLSPNVGGVPRSRVIVPAQRSPLSAGALSAGPMSPGPAALTGGVVSAPRR